MKHVCIASVDAARARLFTYREDASPGQEMREIRDLAQAGRRLRDHDLFSETRPSLKASGQRGPDVSGGPGSDDHRDNHIAVMDAKFAKEIVDEIDKLVRAEGVGHLILIAAPKMLGELRKANGTLKRNGLVVDEIARDLANLDAPQLHDHLASLNMIPGRQRLTMAR